MRYSRILTVALLVVGVSVWLCSILVLRFRANRDLIAALKRNNTRQALQALDRGANPNLRDEDIPVLIIAVDRGDPALVNRLLELGAYPNARFFFRGVDQTSKSENLAASTGLTALSEAECMVDVFNKPHAPGGEVEKYKQIITILNRVGAKR